MRILYLGNFLPAYSTENHISKTLQAMGHQVIEVQEDFTQPEHLAERLGHEEFELFLFTRTWGKTLMMDHLNILENRGIPSVSYHLDLYVGLKRDGDIDSDPFWRTDFVFSTDGDPKSAKVFKKKGINHYYLKPGVYEEDCYMFHTSMDHDIIFVGSYGYHPEYPYRQKLIDWLKNTYREAFELWGQDGNGVVRGEELNRLYSSTKVVIGDSLLLPGHTHYWSDRVYETLGRGGFLIHPYIEGMDEEFVDGVQLAFYKHGDFKELKAKIEYFLKKDDIREQIRHAGHAFVKKNCTYTQRMEQMLETVANARGNQK